MKSRVGLRPILGVTAGLASLLALGALAFGGTTPGSGIEQSPHDFSNVANAPWNTTGEICIVCHTPHGANETVTGAPLWNRGVSNATYNVYSSPTFAPRGGLTITQPDGVSLLCLSCHDGTLALDSFNPINPTYSDNFTASYKPGVAQKMPQFAPQAFLGTDLTNDHPISFNYDANLATQDPEIFMPVSSSYVDGESVVPLYGGKLQCASCHAVHNKNNGNPMGKYLLRVPNSTLYGGQPSGLCFTCHNK